MVNSPSGNVQLMQKINRLKVLSYIRSHEPVSRPQIARETCLSLSSVTNIINYLEERKLVYETGTEEALRVGRKAALLKFNADAYEYICVYIDSAVIYLARTSLSGKIYDIRDIGAPESSLATVLKKIADTAKEMCADTETGRILAVGIALNGSVEDRSRLIISASRKWKNFDIRSQLERELHLPVIVENVSVTNAKFNINNAHCEKITVFMDFDDGIGAVWCRNGEISRTQIGEIGHTIVSRNGDKCFCGGHGCLEVMCSPQRIAFIYKKISDKQLPDDPELAFEKIMEYAENGDRAAAKVIGECIDYLCIGIKNIVMIFNPECIILNGGIYFKHDYIYDHVTSAARFFPLSGKKLEFSKTNMDKKNHLTGVALYMSDCILDISYENCIV